MNYPLSFAEPHKVHDLGVSFTAMTRIARAMNSTAYTPGSLLYFDVNGRVIDATLPDTRYQGDPAGTYFCAEKPVGPMAWC